MGFLSNIANVFTGSLDAKARRQAGDIQSEAAQGAAGNVGIAGQESFDILGQAGQQASSLFDPLAQVGQQGIDLAGFLGNPQAQFESIQANPLFQMGLQNLNEQTQQSAASRGRLSAGDTLQRLTQNATLAATPLIDRQRQDILSLLGIGQGVAGNQANIGLGVAGQQVGVKQQTAQDVANLLTGGAAAQAGGIVGAQNARTAASGNVIDVAGMAIGAPPGTFTGFSPSSGGSNLPVNPPLVPI